jgi:hypothetical protein
MSNDKRLWSLWGGVEHRVFSFRSRQFKKIGLLDPEPEGSMLLRNFGNYLPHGLNPYQHDFVAVKSHNVVLYVN